MSWYDTGFEGSEREESRINRIRAPNRLWIPPGASKDIVFLDDFPFCIYEHSPKIGGSWRNWLTCLKGVHDDVRCCNALGEDSRYYVGFFTVVDCSEWVDKKGTKHQYELKFFPAKIKTLKKFKRKKEEKGSLVGALFTAHREDEKSPSVGDEFTFQRETNLDKLFSLVNYSGKNLSEVFSKAEEEGRLEELASVFQIIKEGDKVKPTLVPFNYFDILKPMSPQEVTKFLGTTSSSSYSPNTPPEDSSSYEDDIPF